MKKQHKFSIWYALVGFWLVFVLHNLIASAFIVKSIPYSDFVKLVKDGKVTEVTISQNAIQGRAVFSETSAENGDLFQTVRVDTDISGLLEESNVTYSGRIESISSATCSHGSFPSP
jgi:cell division protease FtsH